MTWLYFNEFDPFTAQWCRNAWPEAEVDERSILDITRPVDAVRQHYFAGLGGWEHACQLAGWPDDWPLWTGSCPCQPFSVAGKREAAQDERDLWPAFLRLIALGTPPVIIGEQVNGAIAFGWLDRVCDDLEGIGYAVGAAVLPASGVGAPHIRQRLYWVAIRLDYARRERDERRGIAGDVRDSTADQQGEAHQREWHGNAHSDTGEANGVAVAQHDGHDPANPQSGRNEAERTLGSQNEHRQAVGSRDLGGGLGNSDSSGLQARDAFGVRAETGPECAAQSGSSGRVAVAAGARYPRAGQHDGGPSPLSARSEQRSGNGGLADTTQRGQRADGGAPRSAGHPELSGQAGGLGDSARGRRRQRQSENESQGRGWSGPSGTDADSAGGLEHAERASTARYGSVGGHGLHGAEPELVGPRGAWDESKLIYCRDGKFRRIATQPGLQPLADSGRFGNPRTDPDLSSRIGALRAAGNAIVIPLAAEFIRAVMDIVLDKR